ncbi:hypothetical protein ON010_g3499 [Phytophthora cinnamomi]|nr:hypothetical protein ON010_g3499 [Phytophthora cinnamomi]
MPNDTKDQNEENEEEEDASSKATPDISEDTTPDIYIQNLKKFKAPVKTGLKGINIIHDPLYNKGSGFLHVKRDRLGMSHSRGYGPNLEEEVFIVSFPTSVCFDRYQRTSSTSTTDS